MKSYVLEGILSFERARAELGKLLPGQATPWLLRSGDGDVIAYFNAFPKEDAGLVHEGDGSGWHMPYISADISGRHYNEDSAVIFILRKLQSAFGGDIRSDDGGLV